MTINLREIKAAARAAKPLPHVNTGGPCPCCGMPEGHMCRCSYRGDPHTTLELVEGLEAIGIRLERYRVSAPGADALSLVIGDIAAILAEYGIQGGGE